MQTRKLKLCRRAPIIAAAIAALLAGFYAWPVPAANIAVTNVALYYRDADAGQRFVKFDVSWDASWRASWTDAGGTSTNWDAAWIFVKYRPAGSTSGWSHATLSTNNNDHVAPTTNSTINVGLSTNTGGTNFGAGVFLYRSGNGNGSWTNTGVKLRWRYADDSVANTARVDVCVHAIEMVYVPQGSFYLGDGTTTNITGQFENGKFTNAFLVTNDNYIIYLGGGTNGNLGNNNAAGMPAGYTDDFNDVTGQILPPAFPKGYSAFYCMKYELSQGQYADFLNQLTNSTQTTARQIHLTTNYTKYRGTITNDVFGVYTSGAPTRACNFLYWADGAAYTDWAGLRPITELEYEKACRGPLNAVTNEFAWGDTNITRQIGHTGTDGSGTETASPTNANCLFNSSTLVDGPARCGIYATASSGRRSAGASYWGIMEMSGNLLERPVTVGNPTGRGFTGTHGDGKLTGGGYADVPSWPGTNAVGVALRGGCWNDGSSPYLRASDRYLADYTFSTRGYNCGWRAGRSAPVVNP